MSTHWLALGRRQVISMMTATADFAIGTTARRVDDRAGAHHQEHFAL